MSTRAATTGLAVSVAIVGLIALATLVVVIILVTRPAARSQQGHHGAHNLGQQDPHFMQNPRDLQTGNGLPPRPQDSQQSPPNQQRGKSVSSRRNLATQQPEQSLENQEQDNHVVVISADMTDAQAQALLDGASDGLIGPVNVGHFSRKRVLVMFEPGRYRVNVRVGYYMQVIGLGRLPQDTVIEGTVDARASGCTYQVGSLNDFWRCVSNLTVVSRPRVIWATSQATSFRRVVVDAPNLWLWDLFPQMPPAEWPAGYASGGFMANCAITGLTESASQQQYCFRNCSFGGGAQGGTWNVVYVGCQNPPASSNCVDGERAADAPPTTTIVAATPLIREPPFLAIADGEMRPFFFFQMLPT